jgi:hypothetical protein
MWLDYESSYNWDNEAEEQEKYEDEQADMLYEIILEEV